MTMLTRLQARWPQADLEYLRTLATTLLVLVLLPLVIARLLTHPADVAEHAITSRIP